MSKGYRKTNTIFLDFDGVIRLWTGVEIKRAETSLGLELGSLFKIAFSQPLLEPAITGVISDEAWRENVRTELQSEHNSATALKLMNAWGRATYDIDFTLLNQLKRKLPFHKIILTTNATSKLRKDLEDSDLVAYFDAVVNSYEIGCSKPSVEFFQEALSIARKDASECAYIDDSPGNIIAAGGMGIKSELYCSSEKALKFILDTCK